MTPGPSHIPLLEVESLTVAYAGAGRLLDAVREVSLIIHEGETYGLVGESGSGKTTLALSVMRYLPRSAVIRQGRILLGGSDLLALDAKAMRTIWGQQIAFVPQDPYSSLNPSMRIGEQLSEAIRADGIDRRAARERALDLLADVHLPDPPLIAESYPHQISGGMRQRVLIAMAVSREPKLLVMDEPTTGLDTTTQATILDLIRDLIRKRRTSVLYVSHNLGVVAQVCDRVAVLYAGELLEDAPAVRLYARPLHPYTQGLLDSVPRLGQNKRRISLRAVAGRPPSPGDTRSGCVFMARCPLAIELCKEAPALIQADKGHDTRCHRWKEIESGSADPRQPARAKAGRVQSPVTGPEVLALLDVEVHYPIRRSLADMVSRRARQVRAVNGVSLSIRRGLALGLVGESGSGKTTLATAIMGLVERTGGEMRLLGKLLPSRIARRDAATLARMQMIFQDVDESFVPTMSIAEIVRRPLIRLGGSRADEASPKVIGLLEAVHLPPEYADRLPVQLSGGERQRVAIARALASKPDLLVADEPVSSLDVSVQASVLNLLNDIQAERDSGLIFISHDLAVIGYISDVVAVIYLGRLMQVAPADEVFDPPYHPYTEALISAIPLIDPKGQQERIRLEGDTPSPVEIPSGCPFHTRCPRFLGEVCVTVDPPEQRTASGGLIRCHIPLDALQEAQRRVFHFSFPVEGSD